MRKQISIIATIAACALTAYAFWNFERDDHEHDHEHHHHHDHHHGEEEEGEIVSISQEQLSKHGIETQIASSGNLQKIILAPAKITMCPDQVAHVYPKVTGTLIQAYKNLGETVQADEILAAMGSREMAEAKSEYLAAYNRNLLTADTLEREKNLHEKKISAAQEFRRAGNAHQEAEIELELAKQKLHALGLSEQEIEQLPRLAEKNLRLYEMRSPIAGKIISRHVSPGELVNLDHEAFVVADLNKLWVEINVFPNDRQYIKEGQQLNLITQDGRSTKASVIYLSPIINEDTRTSTAVAELDNTEGNFFCGTFAQAEIITDITPVAIMIPKEAVQQIDGTDNVFVAFEEGFSIRPIVIGRFDKDHCEVISGLTSGESYACKNTFLLKAEHEKDEAEHMH